MKPLFKPASGLTIYLASASPRRRSLLASLGLPFVLLPSSDEEPAPLPGEAPERFAKRAARAKVANLPADSSGLFLAADTIVVRDAVIFGKPANEAEALAMLKTLNGETHYAITGVYCRYPAENGVGEASFCGKTAVRFARWPESVLAAYAASDEPLDKAGAYAIQEVGSFLIESIEGSWTNVVGLPLEEFVRFALINRLIEPA